MKVIVLFASFATFAACGVIHDDKHHHQATSYQSIHMEHFHAVPTYIKKEDMHYLEHPISEGKTESKVEVHHGSKHEPGYAVAAIHSHLHGHYGGHKFVAAGGHAYEHDGHDGHDGHQLEQEIEHADQGSQGDVTEVKHYAPAQYHADYSGEVSHDEGHEGHSQEDPTGHYQYEAAAAHDGDENSSYYHEGGEGDDGGHQEQGSYEQEQAHEASAEHY